MTCLFIGQVIFDSVMLVEWNSLTGNNGFSSTESGFSCRFLDFILLGDL